MDTGKNATGAAGPPSDPVEAAVRYAEWGWSVVPMHSMDSAGACTCRRGDCPSPGKHPHIRWEEAMSGRADEVVVELWWGRWPDASVGVVTGAVSGVVVIDVDPRHDGEETLSELESTWGNLPPSLESRTGGGGRHIWFAMPDHDLVSAELGDGVELKAERGLVVAPPSRHVSGGTYRWVDDSMDPAPLPGWVSDLAGARAPARGESGRQPVRTAIERDEFSEAWMRAGLEIRPGEGYYLCPFHDDHHPSLHIDADGCRWYCFACRIGGGTGRLLHELGISRPSPPRGRMRGHVGRRQAVTLPGETPVDVVGESFHQDELLRLAGGQRRFGGVDLETVADVVLIEGDGVEVRIDDNPVGYLQDDDAERLHDRIAESADLHGFASCRASIRGGWDRGGGDVGLFGVTLWMPDEPA